MVYIFKIIISIVVGHGLISITFADDFYPAASPPLIEAPPPPPIPSTRRLESRAAYNDLERARKEYLEVEGQDNKGLMFYETFSLFLRKNGAKNNSYPFGVSKIIDYFGKPDYKRNIVQKGITVTQYAYLFNNHSNKDWACFISFVEEDIISIGYNEARTMLLAGWTKI